MTVDVVAEWLTERYALLPSASTLMRVEVWDFLSLLEANAARHPLGTPGPQTHLREGSHGEIVNERGRTVFEVGFARAIHKVLGI